MLWPFISCFHHIFTSTYLWPPSHCYKLSLYISLCESRPAVPLLTTGVVGSLRRETPPQTLPCHQTFVFIPSSHTCSHSALTLLSNCSHTTLTMLSHYSHNALTLLSFYCSHTSHHTDLTSPGTAPHILLILLLSLLICPSFHSLSYLQNFIILFDWTNGRPTQLMGNFVEIEIKRIPCLYVHTVRV